MIYGDESGFAFDMPRTNGYSPKGQRCHGIKDFGNKQRTNVIGALYKDKLLTVGLFNSTVNTVVFNTWVKEQLLPVLPPKSIFIIDNASFHNKKDLEKILAENEHTLLFLPPYSPDLNKIEHKWSQAKHIRRKYQCDIDTLFKEYMAYN